MSEPPAAAGPAAPPGPVVAVVGGGIAGLAAALAVRRNAPPGTRVVLLEAAGQLGGKLRTSEVAGVAVDEGAEAFLARRPEALTMARELGLEPDLVAPATSAAAVYSRGRLRPLPAGTVLGVPTRWLSLRGIVSGAGRLRAAADVALPRSRFGTDVTVGGYVGARMGREVVDRLVDPLLGGVYAGRADELSLAATVPELWRAVRRHRTLQRAARAALRPAADGPVFFTLPAGLSRFVAAVAAASGAQVRTRCPVRELRRHPDGWRLTLGSAAAPQKLTAAAVVLAVPAAPAARLLAADLPAAAADLAGIGYSSVAVVTLAYREPVPVPGSGLLVPAAEGRLVKAVTYASAKWPHLAAARPGWHFVRCSIGRYGQAADLQREDGELVAAAAAEVAELTGLRATPVADRVTRWGGGLPQYGLGHLDRVARVRAAVSLAPGLAVAGAAYDGVGIPACIGSGAAAGREVAAALAAAAGRPDRH